MREAEIVKNIKARLGIEQLNEMQRRMMRCHSQSVMLLSPTGSGKTIAFTIPMLRALNAPMGVAQAVVIAP